MNPRTEADAAHWRGRAVISLGGERIGTIEEIHMDERTGRPEWLSVTTGLLGTELAFIPSAGAESTDSGVRVPYHRTDIRTVSSAGPDGVLSIEEESALYRHYGLEDADAVPVADPVAEPRRTRSLG
jgi:hypothetical protein